MPHGMSGRKTAAELLRAFEAGEGRIVMRLSLILTETSG